MLFSALVLISITYYLYIAVFTYILICVGRTTRWYGNSQQNFRLNGYFLRHYLWTVR